MMQKNPVKVLKILAAAAGVLSVVFFILTIRLDNLTAVFEPLFVLFLVCAYHCGVRLIMNTSLSAEDAADDRKVRLVHILNIVLGLLSFILILFPHNRILALILIAAVTILFSVNDLVVIRRLRDNWGDSAFDENDEDILNTDASVKAAKEEAERAWSARQEAPEEELPAGRRRRRPVVLTPSAGARDEAEYVRPKPAAPVRTGEISASDAMAAMAGFSAALKGNTPKAETPKAEPPKKPFTVKDELPEPEVPETYAAGPSKMTFAKPAAPETAADETPARKLTRKEKKAAKAKAKAEKAAAELEAARARKARSEAALKRYGNPVEASTFTGLESVLRAGDRYYDTDTDEEFHDGEVHYQDELFSGNHDMFGWRGSSYADWTDAEDEDYE